MAGNTQNANTANMVVTEIFGKAAREQKQPHVNKEGRYSNKEGVKGGKEGEASPERVADLFVERLASLRDLRRHHLNANGGVEGVLKAARNLDRKGGGKRGGGTGGGGAQLERRLSQLERRDSGRARRGEDNPELGHLVPNGLGPGHSRGGLNGGNAGKAGGGETKRAGAAGGAATPLAGHTGLGIGTARPLGDGDRDGGKGVGGNVSPRIAGTLDVQVATGGQKEIGTHCSATDKYVQRSTCYVL